MIGALEPHLTPAQIAEAWGVSVSYVRGRFRREPGVLRCGRVMRIPRAVVERVYGATLVQPVIKAQKMRARRTPDGAIVLAPAA